VSIIREFKRYEKMPNSTFKGKQVTLAKKYIVEGLSLGVSTSNNVFVVSITPCISNCVANTIITSPDANSVMHSTVH